MKKFLYPFLILLFVFTVNNTLAQNNKISNVATADITFIDGSAYSPPAAIPGTDVNPIGRFQLIGSAAGGSLLSVTVVLNGIRSGVTKVGLYSSTDATFIYGSDPQLGGSRTDDNLATTTLTFSGFSNPIDNISGKYYFVVVNLGASATGSVTATIPSQASFTFSGAIAPAAFTNAPLSLTQVPLPVELITFSAARSGNSVELKWSTATEVNNYGFEVERKKENADWIKLGFVNGSGNSNSYKKYFFSDNSNLSIGSYFYRLKQIDIDGSFKYSESIELSLNQPNQFELMQNYPNPFNPTTVIGYQLSAVSNVTLNVYDILGRNITTLVNKKQGAGNYKINFNAGEFNLPGGIYFYKLNAENFTSTKKLILLK